MKYTFLAKAGIFLLFISNILIAQANELPDIVYKEFPIADESTADVHQLIKQAVALVHPQPRQARPLIAEALAKVNKGGKIDEYDYLWAHYGLLKSSYETDTYNFGPGTKEDYIKIAKKVLTYLDREGQVGHGVFTPQGAFKLEVYQFASNGLAWYLQEGINDKNILLQALDRVNKAAEYISGPEDFYILDTKVRILLKLGRHNDAFTVVKKVLDKTPDFKDFQDIQKDEKYKSWLKSRK